MQDRQSVDRYLNRYGISIQGNKAMRPADRNSVHFPWNEKRRTSHPVVRHGRMGWRWMMMTVVIVLLCSTGSITAQSKKSKSRTPSSSTIIPTGRSVPPGGTPANQPGRNPQEPGADPASRIAIAGRQGIYLNTGYEFLSPIHPGSDQAVAIRIERSPAGENQWQEILRYDAPHDKTQLMARMEALGAESWLKQDSILNRIWELIQKPQIDDLPFYFASMPVRRAVGALALDSSVLAGNQYQYRLSRIGPDQNRKPAIITPPVFYPRKIDCPAPKFLRRHSNSGITVLTWIIPATGKIDPSERPISFHIRRQDKITTPFTPIQSKRSLYSSGDTLFFEIHDSLGAADRIARYFIIPTDFYGSEGEFSDTVWGTVYNRLEIPAPSRINAESVDSLGAIRLSWSLSDPVFLKSIRIYRSTDFDTGYLKIAEISPKLIDYLDSQIEPMKIYYYKMCPVTILDEELPATARIHGLAKSDAVPIAPRIIKAEGLSNGVRLEIVCSDPMLDGYRIYRGLPGDSLRLISDLIPVQSMDKPIIPSQGPSKTLGKMPGKSKSSTQTQSVGPSKQKVGPDSDHPEAGGSISLTTVFIDSSRELSGRIAYAYAVRAENTSHEMGEFSDTVWVRPKLPTCPIPPANVQVYPGEDNIMIHWDAMTGYDPDIMAYLVYRRTVVSDQSAAGRHKGSHPSGLKTIPDSTGLNLLTREPLQPDHNYYRDSLVEKGTTYQYRVVSLDRFGGRSGFGMPVSGMIPMPLPLPPDNLRFESMGNGVLVRWDPVIVGNLESYRVYRYERRGRPSMIGSVSAARDSLYSGSFRYLDRSALHGHLYFYYLTTRDSLHRESIPSREVSGYR